MILNVRIIALNNLHDKPIGRIWERPRMSKIYAE